MQLANISSPLSGPIPSRLLCHHVWPYIFLTLPSPVLSPHHLSSRIALSHTFAGSGFTGSILISHLYVPSFLYSHSPTHRLLPPLLPPAFWFSCVALALSPCFLSPHPLTCLPFPPSSCSSTRAVNSPCLPHPPLGPTLLFSHLPSLSPFMHTLCISSCLPFPVPPSALLALPVQLLLGALFSLPTLSLPEGHIAHRPTPTYPAPSLYSKPNPQPDGNALHAKGIQSQWRDKKN